MKLIFASHNENKVKELREMLPAPFVIQSLRDLSDFNEIEETGKTIEANSTLKADVIFRRYKLPCIADDSGLEVDELNGDPGVYSARYAGPEKDSLSNMRKLLDALEGQNNRQAQFKSVITFKSETEEQQFTGIVRGDISTVFEGEGGFGYDPIFIPSGYSRTFAQMATEEKNSLSHRYIAVKKLVDYLKQQI